MAQDGSQMKRRSLLASIATAAVLITGCIESGTYVGASSDSKTASSTNTKTNEPNTQSNRTVVAFENLPAKAQTEVKKAIQQRGYSGCKPLAVENAVNMEKDPLVRYQDQLYELVLVSGGAGKEPEGECPKNALQIEKVTTPNSTHTSNKN